LNRRKQITMQGTLFVPEDPNPCRGTLTDDERINAVALSILSSPGIHRLWSKIATHGPRELYRMICGSCVPATQVFYTQSYPENPLDAAGIIVSKTENKSIRILTYWDRDYPALLREIQYPPLVLYLKGTLPAETAVAVVGTRKSDVRSSGVARRISRELSSLGCAVVSGMAIGIDCEAHLGALEGGGKTVGVLANGIDIIYPWPNRDLYRLIESTEGSALVSEYPPGIFAGRWTFVRRNRIISGLCAGTVVVKAGERSGALITARHAVEQNREVFACAGNSFDEEYAGCHRLVRDGAVLVARTEDIVAELSRPPVPAAEIASPGAVPGKPSGGGRGEDADAGPLPDTMEGKILSLLSSGERDIDSIVRDLASSAGEVNEAVVTLELGGKIIRNGNTILRG
jgi:DNA processing protein